MTVFTGNKGSVVYSIDGGTTWKNFGTGVSINNVSLRREIIQVTGVGCRKPQALVGGRYSASWSIDFNPTDGKIKEIIDDLGLLGVNPTKFSLKMEVDGISYISNDTYASRLTLTSRIGEVVRGTIEGVAMDFLVGTGNGDINCDHGSPITFVDSSVSVDGEDAGYVRSVSININSAIEPVYTLGTEYFQDVYGRVITLSGRMSIVLNSIGMYTKFKSGSDVTFSIRMGSNTLTFTPSKIEEVGTSIRPGEVVEMSLAFVGKDLTVV